MIFPGLKWRKWDEIFRRSMQIEAEGNRLSSREMARPLDPAKMHEEFMTEMDAFIEDTARALGMDRSMVEILAASGELEWKEDLGSGFFVRHEGEIKPLTLKSWAGREPLSDWKKRMLALAGEPLLTTTP